MWSITFAPFHKQTRGGVKHERRHSQIDLWNDHCVPGVYLGLDRFRLYFSLRLYPDLCPGRAVGGANADSYSHSDGTLASKFLIQHKESEFCQKIIRKGMKSFIKNYVQQYDNCKEVPIHFIGSIAYYLKDELQETFDKYELQLGNVLRRPIDGLIAYHIANK